jgi:hypothetical protein
VTGRGSDRSLITSGRRVTTLDPGRQARNVRRSPAQSLCADDADPIRGIRALEYVVALAACEAKHPAGFDFDSPRPQAPAVRAEAEATEPRDDHGGLARGVARSRGTPRLARRVARSRVPAPRRGLVPGLRDDPPRGYS